MRKIFGKNRKIGKETKEKLKELAVEHDKAEMDKDSEKMQELEQLSREILR